MIRSRYCAFALVCIAMLSLTSSCTRKCKVVAPRKAFPISDASYGAGKEVDVTLYDSIRLRPGDSVMLVFPCPSVKLASASPQLTVTMLGTKAKVFNDPAKAMQLKSTGCNAQNLVIAFTDPDFTFYIQSGDYVWPGDANHDERRTMLDLFPIALGTHLGMVLPAGGTAFPNRLNWPACFPEINPLYCVADWGTTFTWGANAIDFKHADCNLGTKIDTVDADYLMHGITPMYLPEFLKDQVENHVLNATPTGRIDGPLTLPGNRLGLCIHYGIELSPNSNSNNNSNVFGVIFSRPVTETAQYQVNYISAYRENSDLFASTSSRPFIRQKYWDDLVAYPDGGDCVPSEAKTVDVGVFNLEGPQSIPPNGRIINCGVTLEDILTPANVGGTVPIIQHVYNGVVFVSDGNGVITAVPASCSTDTVILDMDSLFCKNDLVMRDGYYDDGSAPNADDEHAWVSPDMWFNSAGNPDARRAYPISNSSEEVWVRVSNFNCVEAQNVEVDLYWTLGTTKETWNTHFSSNFIGTVSIPRIPVWGCDSASIDWQTPDFASINPISFPKAHLPIVTVVAVVRGNDPAPDLTTIRNIRPLMLSSNNVAVRSFIVLDALETGNATPTKWGTLLVNGNTTEGGGTLTLHVDQISGPNYYQSQTAGQWHHPGSNYGQLRMLLGSPLTMTNKVNIDSDASGDFLQTGKLSATMQFTGAVPGKLYPIGFKWEQGTTHPSMPVTFQYRVYVTETYGSTVITLNSSVIEFTAQ
jgi:hypothetical protein